MDFVLEQMKLNEIEELPVRVHHALYVFFSQHITEIPSIVY